MDIADSLLTIPRECADNTHVHVSRVLRSSSTCYMLRSTLVTLTQHLLTGSMVVLCGFNCCCNKFVPSRLYRVAEK